LLVFFRYLLCILLCLSIHFLQYVEEPVPEGSVAQTRDKLNQLYHKMIGQPLPEPKEPEGVLASARARISRFFSRATEEYEPESAPAGAARKVSEIAGKATEAAGTAASKVSLN
jgi:hypothetical protein